MARPKGIASSRKGQSRALSGAEQLDRAVQQWTKHLDEIVTGFTGAAGSKSSVQKQILRRAALVLAEGAKGGAPGPTQAVWWSSKYPPYWKYIFRAQSGKGKPSNLITATKGRYVGKRVVVITRTKGGAPGRVGVLTRIGFGPNKKKPKFWTKTLRPRGRLARNIVVKEAKKKRDARGDEAAYGMFVRFSRGRTPWDSRNAYYARFLEEGTSSHGAVPGEKYSHAGIKNATVIGWYARSTKAAKPKAQDLLESATAAYFAGKWKETAKMFKGKG